MMQSTHSDTLFSLGVMKRPLAECCITPERLRTGGVTLQTFALWSGPKGANGDYEGIAAAEYGAVPKLLDAGLKQVDDPADAKDFDDALSIRPAGEGLWEVGVHIADVSHYVTEGSIIDKEAFKRATSIYLVDRTIPMLPERLCNFLCSLRPNEEKLTYSVIFTINEKAEVKKSHITRSIIKSDRRFSYEEVQEIIEKGEGEYYDEINILNTLAQKMRGKRFQSGAIDFQQAEVRFRLDDSGKPLSVYFTESNEAHQVIENRSKECHEQEPQGLCVPHTRPTQPREDCHALEVRHQTRLQDEERFGAHHIGHGTQQPAQGGARHKRAERY